MSPKDPRFEILRYYRSDNRGTEGLNTNINKRLHGGSWRSPYNDSLDTYDNGAPGRNIYYKYDGSRIYFADTGNGWVPEFGGANMSLTYNYYSYSNRRYHLSHSNDVKLDFNAQDAQLSKLSEMYWPDGYEIVITRSSGKILTVQVNKGQRAQYVWGTALTDRSQQMWSNG